MCSQANNELEPLNAAASSNNQSQIVALAGQSVGKLKALAAHPGITPATRSGLNQLADALQAFSTGQRGSAVSAQLGKAASGVATACG